MMDSNSSAWFREWPLERVCETDALLKGENVTVWLQHGIAKSILT